MCTCIVSSTLQMGTGSHQPCMLGVARKLTLRASGGSVALSSDAQTQQLCWTHLRVSQQPQEAASSMCTLHSSSTMQAAINRAHARCCDEAVLASLAWICDAEQLYIDAALVLDASTRVAAAAGSCLIDPLSIRTCIASTTEHLSPEDGDNNAIGQARKLTLRASRGSVTLSSYT